MGNLTADPDLRFTPGGKAVATFTIAVNKPGSRAKDGGKGDQDATFLKIVVWDVLAENCGKFLKKGSPTAVEGRIQNREYTSQTGEKRRVTEIVASNVQFLSSGDKSDASGSAGYQFPSDDDYPVSSGGDGIPDDDISIDDLPF
ncbi:MAG: single-stranded DNA-binding protein [Candidatus Wallbacteria bacterium HGW-Wallbacteria-1]|jgi:single-strand DNA-binding protein|uniref:Single-stranded DNA-binding protein n=1 Tax=Candidatus Wallbacteria bacterium HGW-Wallbacteria-1 TaxID=2013854 RepID=A0A2N1PRQ7_9BACT|nr:MAG: single-stranded DNA-binding protein [Candidatus Wallbacteria bacterium HGW-Wallbacteria-1]